MADTDVIIVGSGHNGLVCGAYLAKAGYTVTVFERRDSIGGAVCTEQMFGGFKLDVGGSAHFMIHHTPIVRDLELDKYGLEYIDLDPFMVAPFDDGTAIAFYRDLDKTCESIATVSPRDAEAYRSFIRRWQPLNEAIFELFLQKPTPWNMGKGLFGKKLHKTKLERYNMLRSLFQSYGRFLEEIFESEKVKAALAWWGAQSGPPPIDSFSTEFVGWHSMTHKIGPARPRGGSGMLTQALKGFIETHGGSVHPNSEVDEIIVSEGRAKGVRLTDGREVSSRAVVANAHIWVTFRRLLRNWISPELRRRIDSIHVGNGFGMVLRSAMDALPRYQVEGVSEKEMTTGLQLLCPSTQYLTDAYADYLRGLPSQDPAAVVMTFSAVDDTLAPAGKHTMFVWGQYYPYELRGHKDWDQLAKAEARKLLKVVDRFAPGTSKNVIDTYIQTPKEIERKHNMPRANVMHVEMVPDQMFVFRPLPELSGYETPLEGLFLASAGTHPGGGIFGAPGYNCSHVVLRKIKKL